MFLPAIFPLGGAIRARSHTAVQKYARACIGPLLALLLIGYCVESGPVETLFYRATAVRPYIRMNVRVCLVVVARVKVFKCLSVMMYVCTYSCKFPRSYSCTDARTYARLFVFFAERSICWLLIFIFINWKL